MRHVKRQVCGRSLLFWLGLLATVGPAAAQQADAPSAGGEEELPPIIDSRSGYVDPAIPGNVLRLRYDSAYRNNQPTRGEYFYARNAPEGPGLPLDERKVDYQDLSLYVERLFGQRLSAFVELPYRMANFDVNEDHAGLGDMNAGFKYALLADENTVLSTQFRVYAPTGNAHLGLGNHHVSLEPALLLYHRFSDRLASNSELRYWGSIGGTAHVQGSLVRYGTGIQYDALKTCRMTVSPVAEIVGWTFLDGEKDPPFGSEGIVPMRNAAGDTIVNAKLGVRIKFGERSDFYAGYGRALTGEVFYKDVIRLEYRILY